MAIRVKHNILVQISGDTDGADKRYYPTSQEEVIDVFDRSATRDISIAAGASEAMSLSDITATRGMYLELSAGVDLILNGSATPLPLLPPNTGGKVRFFMEGTITAITIDNTGGAVAVTGVLATWGDPTP